MKGALKELKLYFRKKVGDAQAASYSILEGKEVVADYRIAKARVIHKGSERWLVSYS